MNVVLDKAIVLQYVLTITMLLSAFYDASGCHTCHMWSDWLNRDEPEGPAENENPELYRKKWPGSVCLTPVGAECRTVGTHIPWNETGEVIEGACAPEFGINCRNHQQPNKLCFDHEARFYCHADSLVRSSIRMKVDNNVYHNGSPMATKQTADVLECARECLRHEKCFAANYAYVTGNCELFPCVCWEMLDVTLLSQQGRCFLKAELGHYQNILSRYKI